MGKKQKNQSSKKGANKKNPLPNRDIRDYMTKKPQQSDQNTET